MDKQNWIKINDSKIRTVWADSDGNLYDYPANVMPIGPTGQALTYIRTEINVADLSFGG